MKKNKFRLEPEFIVSLLSFQKRRKAEHEKEAHEITMFPDVYVHLFIYPISTNLL